MVTKYPLVRRIHWWKEDKLAMANCGPILQFLFLLLCCKLACCSPIDEDRRIFNKINANAFIDRLIHYTPELRLMLNGFLRYQNIAKRPEDSSNRSKSQADDPLATILATGFLGSRGKKDDGDELPVFANGFPAGRG
ncbi:hypothetical protein JTE90_013865 [Oedothorax gibbosus]|uniref:Uncharacterized protein n=1 Tax=Oedothorax gibbosus TaxID=931172 RepID=A0AAV6V8S2_9ARAC|nr:hypothetical protein JTE90_013865 [Oedothorax gibbosus]